MAYWVCTVRGATAHLIAEVVAYGLTGVEVASDTVLVHGPNAENILVRRSLLAYRVIRVVGEASDLDGTVALASSFADAIPEGASFAVRADGPERQELQEALGGAIKDALARPVKLSAPDVTVYVHDADGKYLAGTLVRGELGKRHYKIITGALSLAGPVASAILRIAGWSPDEDLVVWPCATGELAIEAALRASGKSPRAYELGIADAVMPECAIVAADPKLSMVSSAQKNAKIAGVHSYLRFSRQDLDWLDTKHEERGIKYFVGQLPNLVLQPKFSKELFYQLDYLLAANGVACFACVNDGTADIVETEAARSERVYTTRRDYVWSGQQAITILTLTTSGAKRRRGAAAKPAVAV
jgi:23S rRNA G2445 N2-methylase RlmL